MPTAHSPMLIAHSSLPTARARVKAIYDSQIGVKERGVNRGNEVEKYLAYVKLPKGNPWCAAFVCWVLGEAGVENPRSGWSPDLLRESRLIWGQGVSRIPYQARANKRELSPSAGDVFGIYFPDKKRVAHVGFIDKWDGTWLITVEGNTTGADDREGDGVYRKRRLCRSIYRVASYIN